MSPENKKLLEEMARAMFHEGVVTAKQKVQAALRVLVDDSGISEAVAYADLFQRLLALRRTLIDITEADDG